DALGREGYLPKARTGRVKDGVAERGGNERDGRFARPCGGHVGAVDQDAVDAWHVKPEWQAVVRAPVDRRYLLLVPHHLFTERSAHALERAAFDLGAQPVRVCNGPAVLRDHEAQDV